MDANDALRDRFLSRVAAPLRAAFEVWPELGARLAARYAEAAAAHPGVPLDAVDFAEAIALRVAPDGTPAHELEAVRAPDVHLAIACARGDRAALAAFDRAYGPELDAAIAKSPRLGLTADDFRQLVRTKLFVAEEGRAPKIASYSGKGALRSWVRVTAAHVVIDLARARAGAEQPASDDAILEQLPTQTTPELLHLRHAYAAHVPRAFTDALARLSVRQRNLLRQRYLHGLGADKLAPMYGVHRATAFGWLEDARLALLAHLRDALRGEVPGAELESVVGLLGSDLAISVRRLLDSHLEDEPARK